MWDHRYSNGHAQITPGVLWINLHQHAGVLPRAILKFPSLFILITLKFENFILLKHPKYFQIRGWLISHPSVVLCYAVVGQTGLLSYSNLPEALMCLPINKWTWQTNKIIHSVLSKLEVRFVLHTYGAESDKLVLSGVDVLVVGLVSPHVGCAVDQPSGVEHHGVPQQDWDEVRRPQGLPPQVPRYEHRNEEAHEQHGELIIPVEAKENSNG